MKKKKKKQSASLPIENDNTRKSTKAFNWKLLAIVVVNTVIIFGFYRLMLSFHHFEIVMGAYTVITAIVVFSYVIYNRGFTRRNLTEEMLPAEWSDEQKRAYIADGENRLKKSKWMLTIIFPLILTFMFDFIELYWVEMFARWLQ